MEAKSSAGVPLSSPAAAQRCAEGAGLDSGTAAEAQSALPSIAFPAATAADRRLLSTNAAAPAAPQLQSRISTSLTDVTSGGSFSSCASRSSRFPDHYVDSLDRRFVSCQIAHGPIALQVIVEFLSLIHRCLPSLCSC